MKLIFLGPQGSGKSTQAKFVSQKTNLPQIEMGQILRDKANAGSDEGRAISDALQKGNLVDDKITTRVFKDRLAMEDCKNGYILDGYPRNEPQMSTLDSDIDKVFYVNISDDEAISRLVKRGRSDDTPELL